MGEGPAEREMAAVGRVAVTLRVLLEHVLVSYGFFVYGLGVMGGALTLGSLAGLLGAGQGPAMGLGAVAGALAASILFSRLARLAGLELGAGGRRWPGIAMLASFLAVPFIVALASPSRASVSWFPALGLYLVLLYASCPRGAMRAHLYSGVALLALSPPVLYANSPMLAMGVTGLVYMLAGAVSLERGLRRAPGRRAAPGPRGG